MPENTPEPNHDLQKAFGKFAFQMVAGGAFLVWLFTSMSSCDMEPSSDEPHRYAERCEELQICYSGVYVSNKEEFPELSIQDVRELSIMECDKYNFPKKYEDKCINSMR